MEDRFDMDDDFNDDEDFIKTSSDSLQKIEEAILAMLKSSVGAAYNSINSWALVVRATSNDGEGDSSYGGLFMPPSQDMFTAQGLRWLFDEGLRHRNRD